MKLKNLILFMSAGAFALGMSSCENGDISFPDSDAGVQVYFAYQHPIRTIVLGDVTTYDNTRESVDHAFTIYGVSSGSYTGKDIDVEVAVDETLLKGLTFEDGSPVKLMPSNYYQLGGNTLHYGGNFRGGVDVTLSDDFFQDPASVGNTYVIPLVMKSASGEVDGILKGTASQDGALRQDETKWMIAPKDYTLFLVNYINKFDGNYLRRGTDEIANFGIKRGNQHGVIEAGDQVSMPWDNQFWIKSDVPFETGKAWSLKMKIKAKEASTVGTQTHKGLGGYIHWAAIGNVDFTTDWTEFTASGTFTGEQNGGDCIAFNLGHGGENEAVADANTYYFEDIEFIVDGQVATSFSEMKGGWAVKSNINNPDEIITDYNYWVYDENNIKDQSSSTRQKEFIEDDELVKVTTKTLNSATLPVKVETADGTPVTCDLLLTFDGDKCKISVDPDSESAALGFTATGEGEFKSKSEKLAWGNKDRDGLYLNYTINLGDRKYTSQDVLVARDRGNVTQIREFKTTYNEEE